MIKAITVQLYNVQELGRDEFDVPVRLPVPEDVPGVLVYPSSADAVVTDLQLYGRKSVYQLCIPKGDSHEWEDRLVGFFGKIFRTFGHTQNIHSLKLTELYILNGCFFSKDFFFNVDYF